MNLCLGTRVVTKKTAYIARSRMDHANKPKWFTPVRGNFRTISLSESGGVYKTPISWHPITYQIVLFEHDREEKTDVNKSVIYVPEHRSGVIIGLERKMIGQSEHGYDGEQGYLAARGHVDLYVVKTELREKAFYVPLDAVVPEAVA